jgi:hypothetical protein
MLLKIAVAPLIRTRFFLTVDSDVVLITTLQDISWLLPGGRAHLVGETREMHTTWFKASESLVKGHGCLDPELGTERMIGVTPAVLHRDTMASVYQRLVRLYRRDNPQYFFQVTLGSANTWTEYGAYRIMGCLRGDFFKWHTYGQAARAPRFYHGVWSEAEFRSLISEERHKSLGQSYMFLIIQDGHIPVDSEDMRDFEQHLFCPPAFKDEVLWSRFLPTCS